ncbi:hypothetical protein BH09VER1_BH09VER1_28350 [soil metagenome]
MKKTEFSIITGIFLGVAALLSIAASPFKDLTLTGNMDAGGYSITNAVTSTNSASLATVGYVSTNFLSTNSATNFATAAQGAKADTALQSGASRTNIAGLGTAATNATSDFATAAQGVKADTALPATRVTGTGVIALDGTGTIPSNSAAFASTGTGSTQVPTNANLTSAGTYTTSMITGTNNTFIFEGDSITAGGALSAGQDIATVTGLLPDFAGKGTVRNMAIGGTGFLSSYSAGVVTGTLTSSGTTVSIASSASVKFGYVLSGSGIPANTYVMSVPSGTTFTISNAATITGTSNLTMTGTTIQARYQALVYPHRPTANGGDGGTMSVMFLEAGPNDIQLASSATSYSGTRNAYIAQAVADGITVVEHTIMPHDGYRSALEVIRKSVNDSIVTGTSGATCVVDLASLFPDKSNTTFFNADGIHLTYAANRVWASKIQETLRVRGKYPEPRIPSAQDLPYYQRTAVSGTNYACAADSDEVAIAFTSLSGTGNRVGLPVASYVKAGKTISIIDASGSASAVAPIKISRFGYGAGGTDTVNGADIVTAITTPYGRVTAISDGSNGWTFAYPPLAQPQISIISADTVVVSDTNTLTASGLTVPLTNGTWRIDYCYQVLSSTYAATGSRSRFLFAGTASELAGMSNISNAANPTAVNFATVSSNDSANLGLRIGNDIFTLATVSHRNFGTSILSVTGSGALSLTVGQVNSGTGTISIGKGGFIIATPVN